MYVLKELRLGDGGVTDDADVDVAAELDALLGCLVHPTEEHEEHTALNLLVTEHGRRDGVYELVVQIGGGLYDAYL